METTDLATDLAELEAKAARAALQALTVRDLLLTVRNLRRLLRRRVRAARRKPTLKTMERWVNTGIARATDGCRVEPEGTCPHGHPSWLLKLGYI